jgi:hypothetical protein
VSGRDALAEALLRAGVPEWGKADLRASSPARFPESVAAYAPLILSVLLADPEMIWRLPPGVKRMALRTFLAEALLDPASFTASPDEAFRARLMALLDDLATVREDDADGG